MRFLLSAGLVCVAGALMSCTPRQFNRGSEVKEVKGISAINVATDVSNWNRRLEINATKSGINVAEEGYTECASVNEIKGAYLCASVHLRHTNEALVRASLYVEGLFNNPKGNIAKLSSPAYLEGIRSIGGHDLNSDDLKDFWLKLQVACQTEGADVCPSKREKEFFEEFINPKLANNEKFVIISYGLHSILPWPEVVTHEIMHAQYFLQNEFRNIADNFWADTNRVSDSDKASVAKVLSRYYDTSTPSLLKNEFQAYILMSGAESNLLGRFVEKFRAPLLAEMKANGVIPVQVSVE
jgi:hypothetical protein